MVSKYTTLRMPMRDGRDLPSFAQIWSLLPCHREDSGGESFLRRLQGEYLGAMPRTYFLCSEDELENEEPILEADGILIPPIPQAALTEILGQQRSIGDTAARQADTAEGTLRAVIARP